MILNLNKWSDPYNPLVALTWPQAHLKISAMSSPFLCLLIPPNLQNTSSVSPDLNLQKSYNTNSNEYDMAATGETY